MAETLATLARLRRLQATAAKRDFAAALRSEAEAEAALHRARQAPAQEAGAVAAAQDELLLAAAFASWLPRSAGAIRGHAGRLEAATQGRNAASARLLAAEGALEAVGTLQREREVAARKAALRRGQTQLDEAGLQARRKQAVLF